MPEAFLQRKNFPIACLRGRFGLGQIPFRVVGRTKVYPKRYRDSKQKREKRDTQIQRKKVDHSHLVSPAQSLHKKCVIQSRIVFLRKYRCAMAEKVALNMDWLFARPDQNASNCRPKPFWNSLTRGTFWTDPWGYQLARPINWRHSRTAVCPVR